MLILSASQLALQQRLPKMIAVSTQNVNFIIVSKKTQSHRCKTLLRNPCFSQQF